MSVYEKLIAVQERLRAPKSQYNSFGKYSYRNAEDILEAVKPLCAEQRAVIFISDRPVFIEGRFYIEATATFQDVDGDGCVSVSAYAREDESKKGMDGSQVTGAASSYARKYALNGLLCVDDNKDSDALPPETGDNGRQQNPNLQHIDPIQDGPICDRCGKPIQTMTKNGKVVKTADETIKFSKETFGNQFCYACVQYRLKNGDG